MDDIIIENSKDVFVSDHIRIDERSLALHKVIAEKLLQNPDLLQKGKENIKRWRSQGVESSAFKEWEDIIDKGIKDTVAALKSNNEKYIRLRQSTPFTGMLTTEERKNIFESFTIKTYYKSGNSGSKIGFMFFKTKNKQYQAFEGGKPFTTLKRRLYA